jgi:hypothetical protein
MFELQTSTSTDHGHMIVAKGKWRSGTRYENTGEGIADRFPGKETLERRTASIFERLQNYVGLRLIAARSSPQQNCYSIGKS